MLDEFVEGGTPLHRMLAKGMDKRFFRLFVDHGARGDLPDRDGHTAADIMQRKRDGEFQRIALQLA